MKLSKESADRITLLYQVARTHGSLVTVGEITQLMPENTTEVELAEAIAASSLLNTAFEVNAGYITERPIDCDLSERATHGRRTAKVNMLHAARFVATLHSNPFKLVAVSGSTSYGSASHSTDLDLFCVAPTGKMWISLIQGLLMARIFRLLHPASPQICLSCVMDDSFAIEIFSSEQDPLFARDALETKVMKGQQTYLSLMKKATWMGKFYPLAYGSIVGDGFSSGKKLPPRVLDRVVNKLFFTTVGKYLRMKSMLLNRKLSGTGKAEEVFAFRCEEDLLIYESNRYANLRKKYSAVRPAGTVVQNLKINSHPR